jgi:hypothetical protein
VVVKSKTCENLLDPKKCVFDVSSGKLLNYMVPVQGIGNNLKKVKAIKQLQPPRPEGKSRS